MSRTPTRDRPLVVFVGHVARLSGAEIALTRLLPALQPAVDVHVVLGEDGPLVERLRAAGISVEVLAIAPALRDAPRSTVRPAAAPVVQAVLALHHVALLRRRLRQLRPDLVHTNTLKAALYGGLAGRTAGVPVVWHIRDRIAGDYLPGAAVGLVHAAGRVLPSAIITNSRATAATLPVASTVVPNAVVPDAAAGGTPAESRVHERSLVVGVVGRLAAWKGQYVFLEAFAQAFRGTDHRGRLVGSAMFGEQAYEGELAQRIRDLGLSGQVELVGFREDVEAEYRKLDVLVHCSVVPEPFGQVVVEGMAAGLAVIAAAAGGPLEIVESEVDGLLVPPGDVDALTAALKRLADDRALLRRLGERAAVSARRFSPEATARGVLGVYAGVLGREL